MRNGEMNLDPDVLRSAADSLRKIVDNSIMTCSKKYENACENIRSCWISQNTEHLVGILETEKGKNEALGRYVYEIANYLDKLAKTVEDTERDVTQIVTRR